MRGEINMPNFGFHSLSKLPVEYVTPEYSRRNLVGVKEMITWATMKAGVHAKTHSHPHEQFIWVLSGALEVRLGTDKRICRPGDMVLIPGGIEHEALCVEDTEFVSFLSPPRDDLATGAPVPDHIA
jgi:quercetin dioxygenase-like cupin family protein